MIDIRDATETLMARYDDRWLLDLVLEERRKVAEHVEKRAAELGLSLRSSLRDLSPERADGIRWSRDPWRSAPTWSKLLASDALLGGMISIASGYLVACFAGMLLYAEPKVVTGTSVDDWLADDDEINGLSGATFTIRPRRRCPRSSAPLGGGSRPGEVPCGGAEKVRSHKPSFPDDLACDAVPSPIRGCQTRPVDSVTVAHRKPEEVSSMSDKVYVECVIRPGPFSRERSFVIAATDGEYQGVAHLKYLRTQGFDPLPEGQAREGSGWVAARVLKRESGVVTVSVPVEGVISVRAEKVQPRNG